eukprot:GHVR01192315.1.p1 GENE.GHVR01192315.1~~GHVR01192315.1.p1  ORF type:complete len:415 (+),score=35.37 GHVR01192315.1:1898-3142(+)
MCDVLLSARGCSSSISRDFRQDSPKSKSPGWGDSEESDDEFSSSVRETHLNCQLGESTVCFMVREMRLLKDGDARRKAMSQILVALVALQPQITVAALLCGLEEAHSQTQQNTSLPVIQSQVPQLLETLRDAAAAHAESVAFQASSILPRIDLLMCLHSSLRVHIAKFLSSFSLSLSKSCPHVVDPHVFNSTVSISVVRNTQTLTTPLFGERASPTTLKLPPCVTELLCKHFSLIEGEWAVNSDAATRIYSLECLGHLSQVTCPKFLKPRIPSLLMLFTSFCQKKQKQGDVVPLPVLRGACLLLRRACDISEEDVRDILLHILQSLLWTYRPLALAEGTVYAEKSRCELLSILEVLCCYHTQEVVKTLMGLLIKLLFIVLLYIMCFIYHMSIYILYIFNCFTGTHSAVCLYVSV